MGCQEVILVALYEGPCAKEGTTVNTKEGYAKGGGQGALVEQYMCGHGWRQLIKRSQLKATLKFAGHKSLSFLNY